MTELLPGRADIEAAAARLAGRVRRTPTMIADIAGCSDAVLKLEFLQHSGSFKARGAFNRLLAAGPPPPAGVIAASGGNHGAAVAYAARALSVPATIVVPAATPATKVDRIAAYGAQVVRVGAHYSEALAHSETIAAETGALQIHAYDHPDVVAGQGTLAREMDHDAPGLTHVLVAVGGGGLIAGVAAWFAGGAQIISVEPETSPALHHAIAAGHPVTVDVSGIAADSLGASRAGRLATALALTTHIRPVLVPDAAIAAAQRLLWEDLRIVSEPGGATALAALLCRVFVPPPGARVGIVLCGANTNPGSVALGVS